MFRSDCVASAAVHNKPLLLPVMLFIYFYIVKGQENALFYSVKVKVVSKHVITAATVNYCEMQ